MVEIHDKGIGLTAEDFADINHKLANPPTVDAAISQRMGLFVVGRLSDRHGIRVQLRPSGEQAGTTSLVMLPDAITHGGGGEQHVDRDEFTVSQIIPEQNFGGGGENFNQQPMRTAAELGFDDSRYSDVPDDIRELDPVGRSLMREERRAALEAQSHEQPALPGQSGPQHDQATGYRDGYNGQQGYDAGQAYDTGQNGYPEQQQSAYDRQAPYEQQQPSYDEQRHTAYEEPQRSAYDEQYYAPNGGLPQNDTFSPNGGYPEPSYAEPAQEEPSAPNSGGQSGFAAFEQRRHQDDWPQQDGYQNGYPSQYPSQAPETESAQAADASEQDRVGFRPSGTDPVRRPVAHRRRASPPRSHRERCERHGRRAAHEPGASGLHPGEQRRQRLALGQRRAVAAGLAAPEAEGRRGHLLRSAEAGTQGQPDRGCRREHPPGRPPGLPCSGGRPGQAEQPASGRPARTQRRQ